MISMAFSIPFHGFFHSIPLLFPIHSIAFYFKDWSSTLFECEKSVFVTTEWRYIFCVTHSVNVLTLEQRLKWNSNIQWSHPVVTCSGHIQWSHPVVTSSGHIQWPCYSNIKNHSKHIEVVCFFLQPYCIHFFVSSSFTVHLRLNSLFVQFLTLEQQLKLKNGMEKWNGMERVEIRVVFVL